MEPRLMLFVLFAVIAHAEDIDIEEADEQVFTADDFLSLQRNVEDERNNYLNELDYYFNEGIDTMDRDRMGGIHFQSPEARRLEFDSMRGLAATRFVCNRTSSSLSELRNSKLFEQFWQKKEYCKPCKLKCSCSYPWRTADGSCNNLQHPEWGKAIRAHKRLLPPEYGDVHGLDAPRRRGKSGDLLPSARKVTVNMLRDKDNSSETFSKYLTVMSMAWGQFLDHDMTLTPTAKNKKGGPLNCAPHNTCIKRRNCFPIKIPNSDPHFDFECMNFVRSAPVSDGSCTPCRREQSNSASSYIDASMVYGNSDQEMQSLRNSHLLKTYKDKGVFPPAREDTSACNIPPSTICMKTGDPRSNEAPNLGMLHTLFVQEHNRIATSLKALNYYWTTDRVFWETRKIVGALIQHITYNEFLRAMLSKCSYNRLMTPYCYKPKVDATIANSFATAAFRFGHTLITSRQGKFRKSGNVFEELVNTFDNPTFLQENDGADLKPFGRWITRDRCHQADRFFTDNVVDRLFETTDHAGLSLPALNIQRGRDHGLPPYNHWRKLCGLHVAKHFDEMRDHSPKAINRLASTYQYIEDIDIFAGAMTENTMHDAAVGPLFDCLLTEQFKRLREGDRFFYENIGCHGFTEEQLHEIKKMTLAKVMCTNFGLRRIQQDVFRVVDSYDNPLKFCKELPGLDLTKWKDVADHGNCEIDQHKCECKHPKPCDNNNNCFQFTPCHSHRDFNHSLQ